MQPGHGATIGLKRRTNLSFAKPAKPVTSVITALLAQTIQSIMYPDSKRASPYVWTTWIVGLLADVDKCQWKAWFRANYRFAKTPLDEEATAAVKGYTADHDKMVEERVTLLKLTGNTVTVEEQNKFNLKGVNATLSGKPDIIVTNPDDTKALIIDEKSGSEKPHDIWQVKIYLYAYDRLWKKKQRLTALEGEVEYRGSRVRVPAIDEESSKKIIQVMQMTSQKEEPPRIPSQQECGFCNILSCPDRVNVPVQEMAVEEF